MSIQTKTLYAMDDLRMIEKSAFLLNAGKIILNLYRCNSKLLKKLFFMLFWEY